MTMFRLGLALSVLLLSACATTPIASSPGRPKASGGVLSDEQAAYDVRQYRLEIAVDPATRTIQGRLRMRADMVADSDVIVLDLDDHLQVHSTTWNGRSTDFAHDDGQIVITPERSLEAGDRVEVEVVYGGAPRVAPRPPWDGGFTWAQTEDGRPWIATTCQGEGADLWWPCKDHPSDKADSIDLLVTVPDGLVCAANGRLVGEIDRGDGLHSFHWRTESPISNYNVALNIAPYEVLRADYASLTGETFPFLFWVLPEHVEQAEAVLPEFVEHMAFFEDTLGPYPFRNEKYGVAETPHLGMEHQTIIAYGNEFRQAPPGYDWLHHHELSHEWFANLVTCRDWKDMWIHEGFGTYMQALYLERRYGEQAYRDKLQADKQGLKNTSPVAPRDTRDTRQIYFDPDGGYNNDIYVKGAWVLHNLRWLLGDEDFFAGLRRVTYPDPDLEEVTDGSQVHFVDTDDIVATFTQASGRDLGWFFEVTVRQPQLPELRIDRAEGALELSWVAPDGLPYPMPVPVRVGDHLHRIPMVGGHGSVALGPDEVVTIDPDGWLLALLPDVGTTGPDA